MDIYSKLKLSLHLQTQLLEACSWDEPRTKYVEEAIAYAIEIARIDKSFSTEQDVEITMAIIENLINKEELPACKEIIQNLYQLND